MSKYNVGDKVVIADVKYGQEYDEGCRVTPSMASISGKTVTIKYVTPIIPTDRYIVTGEIGYFSNSMIERKVEEKMFNKSDLKVGQIVELRNGSKRMVMPKAGTSMLVFIGENGQYGESDNYSSDLKSYNDVLYDIVKVFSCSDYSSKVLSFDCTDYGSRKVLFERQAEVKELTMDQIAALAGIPVSQLKIKK